MGAIISQAFEFPDPPDRIPDWADKEAQTWRGKDNFDLEVQAEEVSGYRVEIRRIDLPDGVWGLHIARGDRARLCVNSRLPGIWQRFAMFHELYHLISHSEGEHFWRQTFHPISRFESEADLFAWAAIWPDWRDWE
jgi:Zn-dependent peptidase ImmA (M78 family)